MFKVGDKVRVLRDIRRLAEVGVGPYRPTILYATKGEEGVIEEVFRAGTGTVNYVTGRMNAKVRIGENLKTLRLTTIEKL